MPESFYSGGYRDEPEKFEEIYGQVKRHIPPLLRSIETNKPFDLVREDSAVTLYPAEAAVGKEEEFTTVAEEFTHSSGLRIVVFGEYEYLPFSTHFRFPWATERNFDSTGQYALYDDGAIRETPLYPGCLLFAIAPCISVFEAEAFLDRLQSIA